MAINSHKESISVIRPDNNVALILAGNKCDLEEQRVVPKADGEALAKQYGIDFFETSAAKRINVEELFMTLGKKLLTMKNISFEGDAPKDGKKKKEKKDKKGGCYFL